MGFYARRQRELDMNKWTGPTRPYDLVKEFSAVFAVVAFLALTLAALFSSGDEPPATMKSWAKAAPADFVHTASSELAGTSATATYGPPYNKASDGQVRGPLKIQKWVGVHVPVDAANDLVVTPLRSATDEHTQQALKEWDAASGTQQSAWATVFDQALAKQPSASELAKNEKQKFGPVPAMISGLRAMAESGALDGALSEADGTMSVNYTKAWLFLGDSGSYFPNKGESLHLGGDQWGMTNEPGKYPGQPWLAPVSIWYQINPFKSSDNADIQILALVGALSLVLVFLPLIPGLRRIPLVIPVHRLIWKDWYRKHPPH